MKPYILITLSVFLIFYVITGFIIGDMIAINWRSEQRFLYVFAAVMATFISIGIYNDTKP